MDAAPADVQVRQVTEEASDGVHEVGRQAEA
jgi:hypothetical protein